MLMWNLHVQVQRPMMTGFGGAHAQHGMSPPAATVSSSCNSFL